MRILALTAVSVLFLGQFTAAAQDGGVQKRIDEQMAGYDFNGALIGLDSMITVDVNDSLAVAALSTEERSLQKWVQGRRAQCLRKLYRFDEAVEALGAVIALDRAPIRYR